MLRLEIRSLFVKRQRMRYRLDVPRWQVMKPAQARIESDGTDRVPQAEERDLCRTTVRQRSDSSIVEIGRTDIVQPPIVEPLRHVRKARVLDQTGQTSDRKRAATESEPEYLIAR